MLTTETMVTDLPKEDKKKSMVEGICAVADWLGTACRCDFNPPRRIKSALHRKLTPAEADRFLPSATGTSLSLRSAFHSCRGGSQWVKCVDVSKTLRYNRIVRSSNRPLCSELWRRCLANATTMKCSESTATLQRKHSLTLTESWPSSTTPIVIRATKKP